MLTEPARLLVALLLVSIGAGQTPQAPVADQWLIERASGAWQVRESGRPARAIAAAYDVLTAGSQVRCLKPPCVLEYSTDGAAARPLFRNPPPLSQWVAVPRPTERPVAPAAKEMLGIIGRVGVRGGANKDATVCGGVLPLMSPKCYEVIDPTSFTTEGLLVDDDLLAGNVSSVAVASTPAGDSGYCVVTTASGANVIRGFDPATGALDPGAVFQSTSFLTEVVSDGDGYILVPAHDISDPRLIVIDGATGSIVATPRLSLPPFSIAVLTRTLGGS